MALFLFSVGQQRLASHRVRQLAFGRGRWVLDNLKAKGQRINPLSGLKRMFGPQGLVEMGKGLLKVALLGSIAGAWWWTSMETVIGLGRGNLSAQLSAAWHSIVSLIVDERKAFADEKSSALLRHCSTFRLSKW